LLKDLKSLDKTEFKILQVEVEEVEEEEVAPMVREEEVVEEEEVEIEVEIEVEKEAEVEEEEEEEKLVQELLLLEEEAEKPLSKDLMKKVTQSRKREEVTENTEEDQTIMRVKIEKTVLEEVEEKERKVVRETTERRMPVRPLLKVPKLLKPLFKSKRRRSQKLKLNTKLLDNPFKISMLKELLTSDKPQREELLKLSKVSKLLMDGLVRKKLPEPSTETHMLPTTSLPVKEPTSWDSEPSKMSRIMSQRETVEEVVEVEEEEVAEEAEEETEEVLIDQKVKEELTQSNPSRKLKKISQLYEREDLVDLPSKELAEWLHVDNRLLIVLKRFS
jgi:hypothetical protein